MDKISIVVPICNEEKIIEKEIKAMLSEITQEMLGLDYEILLVENGSLDNTQKIAEKLGHENSKIKTISLPRPDYGGALKTGILESWGDKVAIFNIDFWDIDFIKRSLALREPWDLIIASKNAPGAQDLRSKKRRLATRAFNFLLRLFFGFRGTDTHGIKIMNQEKISSIVRQCRTSKLLFDTELILRCQHKGLVIKEIPIICEEKRPSTLISSNLSKIIKMSWRVLKDLLIIFFSLRLSDKKQKISWLTLGGCIAFIFIFSWPNLTTKPYVWYDEGINIELARNFSEFGKLDLIVQPMAFAGQGSLIGSTGYPVTVPLGIFFKIFGFGFAQARIYMIFWMIAALIGIFLISRKIFGNTEVIPALLLVTSFSSFYGNGRSVMGEIPGFVFMLLSFWWYLSRKKFIGTGVFMGLAVISKPSVFIFLIPAWLIFLAFEKRRFLSRVLKLAVGSIIPFLVWAFIYSNQIFSLEIWKKLKEHFVNPYQETGISSLSNIRNNLADFFHTPTLIYFSFFAILIIFAVLLDKEYYRKNRFIFIVSGWYSLLAFLFFLKSLGYLRYIIAVELMILILLMPSVVRVFKRFWSGKIIGIITISFLLVLICFQFIYLLTAAKLFYSDSSEKIAKYVLEKFPDKTVGVINIPPIASLVPARQRFQIVDSYGLRTIGVNPLLVEENKLPEVVVLDTAQPAGDIEKTVLYKSYHLVETVDNMAIFEKF